MEISLYGLVGGVVGLMTAVILIVAQRIRDRRG